MMVTIELVSILAQRIWQSLAGLITVVFVLTYLSPEEQGWYYTFLSIVAWYAVLEFGFSTVLLHVSGPAFSGLRWVKNGNLIGDNSERFISFLSQAIGTCIRSILKIGILVLIAGLMYFLFSSEKFLSSTDWIAPWVALVISAGLSMLALSYLSIIEGTGNIAEVYLVRFVQTTGAALLSWFFMANGFGLWAAIALPTASWTTALCWLLLLRRDTLKMTMKPTMPTYNSWLRQTKQFRQRTAVGWVGIYGTSQLITPIIFQFEGPEMAGRFGLSLAVAHMIGILAQSSVASLLPRLSASVTKRENDLIKKHLFRALTGLVLIFSFSAFLFLLIYERSDIDILKNRFLDSSEMIGLLAFTFFYQTTLLIVSVFRANQEDPLAWIYAISAIIIVSGSVLLASRGHSDGILSLMLAIQILVIFPSGIWYLRKFLLNNSKKYC